MMPIFIDVTIIIGCLISNYEFDRSHLMIVVDLTLTTVHVVK